MLTLLGSTSWNKDTLFPLSNWEYDSPATNRNVVLKQFSCDSTHTSHRTPAKRRYVIYTVPCLSLPAIYIVLSPSLPSSTVEVVLPFHSNNKQKTRRNYFAYNSIYRLSTILATATGVRAQVSPALLNWLYFCDPLDVVQKYPQPNHQHFCPPFQECSPLPSPPPSPLPPLLWPRPTRTALTMQVWLLAPSVMEYS